MQQTKYKMLGKEAIMFAFATICVLIAITVISIAYFLIYKLTLLATLNIACILISFYVVGAALKFVDDAYDDNKFSKKYSIVIMAGATTIMLILSSVDGWIATISFAVLVGVILAKKVDNYPFIVFAAIFIIIIIILGIDRIIWHFFAIVSTAVFIDEMGAEIGKKHWKRPKPLFLITKNIRGFVFHFLRQRRVTLFVLLGLGIIGWIPLLYWFAWAFFDIGYEIMETIGSYF